MSNTNTNYFHKYATSKNRTEYKRIMNDIDKATTEEKLNKLGKNMMALHKKLHDDQETRSRASSAASAGSAVSVGSINLSRLPPVPESSSPPPPPTPSRKSRRTRRKNRSRRR